MGHTENYSTVQVGLLLKLVIPSLLGTAFILLLGHFYLPFHFFSKTVLI